MSRKIYRAVSKPFRFLAEPKVIDNTMLKGREWFDLISQVNRQQTTRPPIPASRPSQVGSIWVKIDNTLQSILLKKTPALNLPTWKNAFNALGAGWRHSTTHDEADFEALRVYFDHLIDEKGNWKTKVTRADQCMSGYTLLYLAHITNNTHFLDAANSLATFLTTDLGRTSDGVLPYDPETQLVLVDTLGMICPFLARYARMTNDQSALDLAILQLMQFIHTNLDEDTSLPYHAYHSGSAVRQGLHGWGRGTGWFLLGLIDTIAELPHDHPDFLRLSGTFRETVATIKQYQRPDGHWSWAILQPSDSIDSSTTAFLSYAIIRGVQSGVLGEESIGIARRALHALIQTTNINGEIDGGLGECRGIGKYPQIYGSQSWLQGAATASASIFFSLTEDDHLPEIVITNITGLQNRGVEAFLQPTLDQISQHLPNVCLKVITNTPGFDRRRVAPHRAMILPNDLVYTQPRGMAIVTKMKRSIRKILKRPEWSEFTQANLAIRRASAVVALGGDVFSSDYSNLHRHLKPLAYAAQHHVPIIFLGQSIGPFKNAEETEAWIKVAERASLITVRESLSYQYLTQELGLPVGRVHLTADPAFLLQPPPSETIHSILADLGVSNDEPIIALSISRGISRFRSIDPAQHFKAWQNAIRQLLNETPAEIILIPHVRTDYAANDDYSIAAEILQSLDKHPRIHLAQADYSAAEYKGIISACQMIVAERMHAAYAGLSSQVCTVVLGYSVKAQGVLFDLFGPNATRDNYLIPVEEFVCDDNPGRKLLGVWENRHKAQEQLKTITPLMQERAASNFSLLLEALQSSHAL